MTTEKENEQILEENSDPIELITIDDAAALRWYDTGFKFAINYMLAWITNEEDDELDRDKYIALVNRMVGADYQGNNIIDEHYFENLHFYQGGSNYGSHQCPDPNDPRLCIPCTTRTIQPVPRP